MSSAGRPHRRRLCSRAESSNQADFLTSSTHTPTRDTLLTCQSRVCRVRHETNRKVPESRLPPFTAVGWLTPRRSLSTTTQTRHPLERPLVSDGARASVFGRAFCFPASLSLGCVGRLGWVFVSPAPTGVGANRPPLTGGQLTFGVLVDVPPPVCVRWRSLGRGRLRPSQRGMYKIFGRNLKLGSFLKSRSRAGYICFMSLHAEV